MLSILDVKRKLPKEFVNNLYELYTPLMVDKILSGLSGERLTTVRINTIKYSVQDFMKYCKENNIKFERVLWYNDAVIIKNANEKQIQKLDIYEKGYIYLQSLSSMIPPIILNPKSGEKVLDLTAAPGSKTTQISALMKNEGYILANELDKIRCERLKYNIQKQGANIVDVLNQRGEKIGKEYAEEFDKVLLDAPCSGEGRFLANSAKTYRDWSPRTVKELSKLQKKLFKSAYESLKPNGEMVYSTCTINTEENEQILKWAIENLNLKILDIKIEIKDKLPIIIEDSDKKLKKEIEKSIKIMPSKVQEGFFVAKIQKCK